MRRCVRCDLEFTPSSTKGVRPRFCSAVCRRKSWHEAHPGWWKEYRTRRLEHFRAADRVRVVRERPRRIAYLTKWRKDHPEYRKAYRLRERDRFAGYKSKRRALLVGNGGSHTVAEWTAKKAEFGNTCFYCGAPGRLERDHAIPITRGGTDDISNILPCCRLCNLRKRQKTVAEFRSAS